MMSIQKRLEKLEDRLQADQSDPADRRLWVWLQQADGTYRASGTGEVLSPDDLDAWLANYAGHVPPLVIRRGQVNTGSEQ